LALNAYEGEEIAFFKRYITSTMTIIDIGANVGLYSAIALASKNFSGTILCMEPHIESRASLAKNVMQNNQGAATVIVSELAASNTEGVITLYKNPENKGDNRIYADDLLAQHENITVTTLDKICSLHEIRSVDFIKMDVQGAEEKVIEGAMSIISSSESCILLSEFWPYGLEKSGGML